MARKAETVDIKIKLNFAGHEVGDVVTVPAMDGLPLDLYWQRRLRDAAVDDCCELVKKKTKKSNGRNGSGSTGGSD